MPPKETTTKGDPDLQIVLDRHNNNSLSQNDRPVFRPGDTITGHVVRKSALDDPNASIVVRLHGAARVSATVNSGLTHAMHKSHVDFFSDSHSPGTASMIHQGPLRTSPDDAGRWPFAVTIPQHPDVAAVRKDKKQKEMDSFLQAAEDAGSHLLPPTFHHRGKCRNIVAETWVEFFLEATLQSSRRSKSCQAIQEITVLSFSTELPITDFKITPRPQHRRVVQSPLLLPDAEKLNPSLGQKTKSLLGFSKDPSFAFSLQILFPSVIQMGHPDFVPLQLRAVPIESSSSDDVLVDHPTIFVERFELRLEVNTSYVAKATGRRSFSVIMGGFCVLASYHWKRKTGEARMGNSATAGEASPGMLAVPLDDQVPALDLGQALGTKMPQSSVQGETLFPAFTTYNMRHGEHQLCWKLDLNVVGKTIRYEGKQPVNVIGPGQQRSSNFYKVK